MKAKRSVVLHSQNDNPRLTTLTLVSWVQLARRTGRKIKISIYREGDPESFRMRVKSNFENYTSQIIYEIRLLLKLSFK